MKALILRQLKPFSQRLCTRITCVTAQMEDSLLRCVVTIRLRPYHGLRALEATRRSRFRIRVALLRGRFRMIRTHTLRTSIW